MRPRRSLPTSRTRVTSASRSAASRAPISGARPRGGRGGGPAARGRPGLPRGEPAGSKIGLDGLGELEKPEAVGDAAPILADALGELLLGPGELRQELLIGLGLLDGVPG